MQFKQQWEDNIKFTVIGFGEDDKFKNMERIAGIFAIFITANTYQFLSSSYSESISGEFFQLELKQSQLEEIFKRISTSLSAARGVVVKQEPGIRRKDKESKILAFSGYGRFKQSLQSFFRLNKNDQLSKITKLSRGILN